MNFATTEIVTREYKENPRGIFSRFSAPKLVERQEVVERWNDAPSESTVSQIEVKLDEENQNLNLTTYPNNLTFRESLVFAKLF